MESLRVCAETGTFEGNKQGETGDDDTHNNHPGAQKPKLGQTDVDKYFHLQENTIMHEIDPQTGSDMRLDAQRDIIRQSLDTIINDIGVAMRDVGLTFPVYMTVRNSGDALVTHCDVRSIHQMPTGSLHRQSSVEPLKRGLAAIGCEVENSPVQWRTPG